MTGQGLIPHGKKWLTHLSACASHPESQVAPAGQTEASRSTAPPPGTFRGFAAQKAEKRPAAGPNWHLGPEKCHFDPATPPNRPSPLKGDEEVSKGDEEVLKGDGEAPQWGPSPPKGDGEVWRGDRKVFQWGPSPPEGDAEVSKGDASPSEVLPPIAGVGADFRSLQTLGQQRTHPDTPLPHYLDACHAPPEDQPTHSPPKENTQQRQRHAH